MFKYPYIINPIKAIIKQYKSLDILPLLVCRVIIVPRGEFLGEWLKVRMVKDPFLVTFLIPWSIVP